MRETKKVKSFGLPTAFITLVTSRKPTKLYESSLVGV
jgi:hypothetical protein